jgi:hypothetical protein
MFRPGAGLPTIAGGCLGAIATTLAQASPAHQQPSAKRGPSRVETSPPEPEADMVGENFKTFHVTHRRLGPADQQSNEGQALDTMSACTSRVAAGALGSHVRTHTDV